MKNTKYPKFTKKELNRLEILDGLYGHEHGGCDDTTCSMRVAMEHGYSIHALDCFASSGAASDEFYSLWKRLPKNKVDLASTLEGEQLCKEVSHAECRDCGSTVWELEWNEGYCSNCGSKHGAKRVKK